MPEASVSGLAMALHELATNAVKYGSLSVPSGRVVLSWQVLADGTLHFCWKEKHGPHVVPPEQEGFGTMLLRRGALPPPHQVELFYLADGLEAHLRIVGACKVP